VLNAIAEWLKRVILAGWQMYDTDGGGYTLGARERFEGIKTN
jgi:hypothetical protein